MAKRLKIIILLLGIVLFLSLVILNIDSFIETTNRLGEILKIDSLKNIFEVYNDKSTIIYEESVSEISTSITSWINQIQETFDKPFEQVLLDVLIRLLELSCNFLIYFCNYGLNIILITFIFLRQTINGEEPKIKTSLFSRIFIIIDKIIETILKLVKNGIKWCLNQIYNLRKIIALMLAIVLVGNGFIYRVIVEFIIFMITYVIGIIEMEVYLVLLDVTRLIFTLCYPILKEIPLWIYVPTLSLLLFLNAINRANFKLKKNHERLKEFAENELTQTTFINGPPGTGKTLLNVSLSLASEENFIEELEKKLLDYELNYKYLNFAYVRADPHLYPEHEEYNKTCYLLNQRGTFLISNYAIYSPYFKEYSKIFNFDYMRVNKPTDIYPLEEYIVISLSEFDKEYNSHDDKKAVGEDGAHTFFSTVSHNLKRHAKIFVDYQLKDQVPLRIRGNAEYFITIKKRDKKYPILLMLYYLPFMIAYKLVRHFIKKYEKKKEKITRTSMRKSVAKFKRNDITLPYTILRRIATPLKIICKWFDSFYYFKLSTVISQEGEDKGVKKKLCINIRDLSYKNQALYDSTFLSFAYEEKKNEEFKNLDKFTMLAPPEDELSKCNSKFYNQINN